MRIFTTALCLAFLLNTYLLKGQPSFPENGELYVTSVVPRVDIRIHPDTLKWIYDNPWSDREFRALFIFNNEKVNDTVKNVGFRFRGNTSRWSGKQSFKISFNTFEKGREYQGVEKMNLNGEHNDPSISRARIYWEILRRADIAGPRANHARLFINGKYHGLYLNVEHIDEEFTKAYYGSESGNLYKCLFGANLTYKGTNPDLYKYTVNGTRIYDLKTNKEVDDYSDLAKFINVLNNTPLAQLPCELEKVFNVQEYLKIAAVDVLTGNWDGYIYNNNNYYLYNNPRTGLFEYIPYDVDNTFGIDWSNYDWSTRNVYNWSDIKDSRPLFTRLMQVPEYKAQYTYYLRQIINSITSQQSLIEFIYNTRDQIRDYVKYDTFYTIDYGYILQSFDGSWTAAAGGHVKSGIIPFIDRRNTSALTQMGDFRISPMISKIEHNSPLAMSKFIVNANVEGVSLATVKLDYSINKGAWQSQIMNDKGENGDLKAGDNKYTASIPGMVDLTKIEFQVSANDLNQTLSVKPCLPITYTVPVSEKDRIYINEFMTSNKTTIADDKGEFDDWVELYNASNEPVWIGNKYLSDNYSNPVKWKLPSVNIQAGGFLLLWLDGQPEQGTLHAPFKLSKEGEEIGLFDADSEGNRKIDGIEYITQMTDVSVGRQTDGADDWVYFSTSTPGKSNNIGDVKEEEKNLIAWPNPISKGVLNISEITDIKIYDLTGRLLLSANNTDKIDISTLRKGIMVLMTKGGASVKIVII